MPTDDPAPTTPTIPVYLFVSYEVMLKIFEHNDLKLVIPQETNDPFEFLPAESNDYNFETGTAFLSFSMDHKSPSLWGHYADLHKGCCIRFDLPIFDHDKTEYKKWITKKAKTTSTKLDYAILAKKHTNLWQKVLNVTDAMIPFEYMILLRVAYLQKRIKNADGLCIYNEGKKKILLAPHCFVTKSCEWSFEKEVRLIFDLNKECQIRDNMLFISGFNEHITRVYLGLRCPHSITKTQSIINYWCQQKDTDNASSIYKRPKGVEVYATKYAKNTFEVEINEDNKSEKPKAPTPADS